MHCPGFVKKPRFRISFYLPAVQIIIIAGRQIKQKKLKAASGINALAAASYRDLKTESGRTEGDRVWGVIPGPEARPVMGCCEDGGPIVVSSSI